MRIRAHRRTLIVQASSSLEPRARIRVRQPGAVCACVPRIVHDSIPNRTFLAVLCVQSRPSQLAGERCRPSQPIPSPAAMSAPIRARGAAIRRPARGLLARIGKEEQARQIITHLREARSAFRPLERRELRDEHGLHVVLASVLRADSCAVDVGANEGNVLRSIMRIAPLGQHIAFEPIPALYRQLLESFPEVEVRQSALADVTGMTEFVHVVDAPAYSGLRQRRDLPAGVGEVERIAVRTERLDDVLANRPAPTVIKIDVEGAELGVMQGALDTLQRHRPVVIFEHGAGGADLYGTGPTDVFDLLDGSGLRIFDLDGAGPYSRALFEDTFARPIWNFIAAPA
jgi:FkbM family methyltransferase